MRASVGAALLVLATAQPALAAGGGIEIIPDPLKLVALILLFAAVVAPVNKLILQPMLGVLEERSERIDGTRDRAAAVAREADEVLGAYESGVARAREQAEAERRRIVDEARHAETRTLARERGDAEQQIEKARAEVDQALEQARAGLRSEARDLARQAAERVLGRSL
jgi:F0F1-type ATP synthase membrane subunit b/b'